MHSMMIILLIFLASFIFIMLNSSMLVRYLHLIILLMNKNNLLLRYLCLNLDALEFLIEELKIQNLLSHLLSYRKIIQFIRVFIRILLIFHLFIIHLYRIYLSKQGISFAMLNLFLYFHLIVMEPFLRSQKSRVLRISIAFKIKRDYNISINLIIGNKKFL